ncbi:MAG: hypothetical protein K2W85_02635 [Phycisphaerales bacterium]|nr:hypothetical protein [Phycisphaerales bacterium]
MAKRSAQSRVKKPAKGASARPAPEGKDRELSNARDALLRLKAEPAAPRSLVPGDHVRLLIELLRPLTPELSRRWLSALLLVPEDERPAVVARVERAIVESYSGAGPLAEPIVPGSNRATDIVLPSIPPDDQAEERQVHVVFPPKQREGYVEQVVKTYTPAPAEPKPRRAGERDSASA